MWFGFPPLSPCLQPPMQFSRTAVAVALGAAIGMLPARSASHAAVRTATACVHISRNVANYCGPATAQLSVFPGAVFRNGTCTRRRIDAVRLLQVRIGARSLDGSQTNHGLQYFSLGSADSRSQPQSGNVVAYYRSRRWFGRGVFLKGGAEGGTFLVRGVAGNRGRAIASFRC